MTRRSSLCRAQKTAWICSLKGDLQVQRPADCVRKDYTDESWMLSQDSNDEEGDAMAGISAAARRMPKRLSMRDMRTAHMTPTRSQV